MLKMPKVNDVLERITMRKGNFFDLRQWASVFGVLVLATTIGSLQAAAVPLDQQNLASRIPLADRGQPQLRIRAATRSTLAPSGLQCNWLTDPLGIQKRPRLTWMPPQRQTLQHEAAYQIQVAASRAGLKNRQNVIWDSGKVKENPAFLPQYNGPALKPFARYYWRVRVWSRSGWESHWSRIANWMTGPLKRADWRGSWISYRHKIINPFYTALHNAYYGLPLPKKMIHGNWIQNEPCPILRKVFRAPEHVSHAYMYIAGLGYWKVLVNGHAVGPGVLYSTLYDYSKAVPYQSFDITPLLRKGRRNVITIALGNGWYNIMERDVWGFQNAFWRAWPRARMNLRIQSSNGKTRWVVSDSAWQAADGPRLADGVYNGEVYDAALKIHGWNNPDRSLNRLAHAEIVTPPKGRLISQLMPPCEVLQRFQPVAVTEPVPHVFVVKFPQNISGWVTLAAKGQPGVPVVLRYGERLFPNGLVDRRQISQFAFTGSFQTDTIIPASHKPFTYHPNFAYNGFQYVQINGLTAKKDILHIQADFIHTAFHRSGMFWCANPLLNAIADCANRSYCSNFMGYPTDCPTREKNGWTGDAWLASVQGMMTYNNQLGYAKWLQDIAATEYPDGRLRVIMPDPSGWDWDGGKFPDPDWESAFEFVAWNQYLYSGDGGVLREHFQGIKRYFLYTLSRSHHDIMPEHAGIGDWASSAKHVPSVSFTSTCILYHDAVLLSRISSVLGKPQQIFRHDATAIKKAFNARFYKGHGQYGNGGQTAEAMPLYYGLVPAARVSAVVKCLVHDVHIHADHLDVGILGDKCLFRVLTRYGHTALAYRIATQRTYPSYGQWIFHGATTLWEAWGLDPASMNHIMFGDVLGWMYNDLAGIRPNPKKPGFRSVIIAPHPVRALHWAGATHRSRFGLIRSKWRWHGQQVRLDVSVPPATSGVIHLHVVDNSAILCNGVMLNAHSAGVTRVVWMPAANGQTVVAYVAAGHYIFTYSPSIIH
jgi:alpha-L-rhamnosidase